MKKARTTKVWEPIDFTIYFSFVRWTVVVALIVEIIFRIWSNRLSGGMLLEQQEVFIWIIRILAFGFLGWRTIKQYGESLPVAAIAGAISGFCIGLVISLYRFVEGIYFWKLVNILTETTLTVIVGTLTTILVIYILSFKYNN